MAAKRINNRKTLSERAKELGIDTYGMTRSEKEEAIDTEENKREEQEEMARFMRERIGFGASGNSSTPYPANLPEVRIAPAVTSVIDTPGEPAPPVKTRINAGDGGGGGIAEVVVVDNGEFKKGNFYIDGELTSI